MIRLIILMLITNIAYATADLHMPATEDLRKPREIAGDVTDNARNFITSIREHGTDIFSCERGGDNSLIVIIENKNETPGSKSYFYSSADVSEVLYHVCYDDLSDNTRSYIKSIFGTHLTPDCKMQDGRLVVRIKDSNGSWSSNSYFDSKDDKDAVKKFICKVKRVG